MSLTGIPEFKESYRTLGPKKFWLIMGLTLTWIAVFVWLEMAARWPGNCDREGRRLIGFVKELYCSSDLLRGGGVEYGLFAFLWSMPALVAGTFIWAAARKLRGTKLSIYSDETEQL